jgi:hypothetical protein
LLGLNFFTSIRADRHAVQAIQAGRYKTF